MTAGEIAQPGATGKASQPARPSRGEPGGRPLFLLTIVIGLCLGLPVVVIVVRAVLDGSLATAVTDRVVLDALVLSLVTTAVSLLITIVAGLPLAFVLARRQFRGRALLEAVIDLPIVLPPSVAGLALLLTLGREGLLGKPLGALGIELPFTTVAVVLAQAFVSAPFFIRSARLGFASIDRHLEDAARVDGATEAQLFRSISLPLAGSALAAGLVMSWARSLGEFGATIMFAGQRRGEDQTLPPGRLQQRVHGGNLDGSIAAAAILVLCPPSASSSPCASCTGGTSSTCAASAEVGSPQHGGGHHRPARIISLRQVPHPAKRQVPHQWKRTTW